MRLAFLLPDDLQAPTGGYAYARHLIVELRAAGIDVQVHPLPGTYPNPDETALRQAASVLASLADRQTTLIDGLALGVLAPQVAEHSMRLDLVALVHHPLYLESGIDARRRQALFESERAALGHCNRIITTSATTAGQLTEQFGVPVERVYTAEPGTDLAGEAPEPLSEPVSERVSKPASEITAGLVSDLESGQPSAATAAPVRLLCVASLVPRKGHLLLLDALAGLRQLDWQLCCVGALDRDVDHLASVHQRITTLGLESRVMLVGALDDTSLQQAWRCSDAFVLASEHEGYGMAFAEALAAGLPIIGTTAAAVPQLRTAGARLVPPADVDALRLALSEVIRSPKLRRAMAGQARAAALSLPGWRDTARGVQRALQARHSAAVSGQQSLIEPAGTVNDAIAVKDAINDADPSLTAAASFSAQWLLARERFDAAARTRAWPDLLVPMRALAGRIQRVIDLGCGTGSNRRYLTSTWVPLMPHSPRWLLIDADSQLLATAQRLHLLEELSRGRHDPGRAQRRRNVPSFQRADLTDERSWPRFNPDDLITASALIDLVSKHWLVGLVERCRQAGAALHLALTYDGRSRWLPRHPLDSSIQRAFDQDQQTDKGFGLALGPAACSTAIELLEQAGFCVWSASSDWLLDSRLSGARRLIEPLIENHARLAARGEGEAVAGEVAHWAAQRRWQSACGRLRVSIGHRDIVAIPGKSFKQRV